MSLKCVGLKQEAGGETRGGEGGEKERDIAEKSYCQTMHLTGHGHE